MVITTYFLCYRDDEINKSFKESTSIIIVRALKVMVKSTVIIILTWYGLNIQVSLITFLEFIFRSFVEILGNIL